MCSLSSLCKFGVVGTICSENWPCATGSKFSILLAVQESLRSADREASELSQDVQRREQVRHEKWPVQIAIKCNKQDLNMSHHHIYWILLAWIRLVYEVPNLMLATVLEGIQIK
jgi:hypothetical protein